MPSYLQWQHHQSHTDHDDHQQLGGPDAWRDVSEAHGGERDDAEVEGVKEGEVFACSLQVLDPTCAVQSRLEKSCLQTKMMPAVMTNIY